MRAIEPTIAVELTIKEANELRRVLMANNSFKSKVATSVVVGLAKELKITT